MISRSEVRIGMDNGRPINQTSLDPARSQVGTVLDMAHGRDTHFSYCEPGDWVWPGYMGRTRSQGFSIQILFRATQQQGCNRPSFVTRSKQYRRGRETPWKRFAKPWLCLLFSGEISLRGWADDVALSIAARRGVPPVKLYRKTSPGMLLNSATSALRRRSWFTRPFCRSIKTRRVHQKLHC